MIVYFDSSAIIARYVPDRRSAEARATWRSADRIVCSLLGFPECLAALARMAREGALEEKEHSRVVRDLERDWSTLDRVRLDQRHLPEVRRVLRYHPLRGADAVHLATALLIQRRVGALTFACEDAPLCRAAAAEGLALAW